ncbi:uncharacterized protein J3R85_011072 [Psidium guajava]|nr:uncharacterized protein J3R85_011072 [Psidium guajava]
METADLEKKTECKVVDGGRGSDEQKCQSEQRAPKQRMWALCASESSANERLKGDEATKITVNVIVGSARRGGRGEARARSFQRGGGEDAR